MLRAGGVTLRHLARALEAREHLLHRGELRVCRLALGAFGMQRGLEGAELGGELLVLTLEGLKVEEGGGMG